MRSASELVFRVRQELANLRLLLAPPSGVVKGPVEPVGLADPSRTIDKLRNTEYRREIERIANSILGHRFPLPGGILETGPAIQWRRDYRNGRLSDSRYFRLVPYLDFHHVGDHKIIWDLNRHQHLVVLAQAFLFTSHERYLQEIERQIQSWVQDNPYMRGVNWTSALEVAFRALSWVWVLKLVGKHLNGELSDVMTRGLHRHGRYLEENLSVYFSPNTHLLGEAVALHALGALFPAFPTAGRWKRLGAQLVAAQMDAQVRDDGSHFEQSSYYHVYALDLFLFHQALAETNSEYRAKLRKMADYLTALMGPDRTLPAIGDDDGGRVFHPYGRRDRFGRATLATCAVLFSDGQWEFDEQDVHEQAAWWLGERAFERDRSEIPVHQKSLLFPEAGLCALSAGQTQVLVDAGQFGPGAAGHSHSDTLSIVVRDGSEDILIDAGTYTYVSDPAMRDWFRGSSAHNTLRVNATDQAIPAGAFRWTAKPDVEIMEWMTDGDHDLIDAVCRSQGGRFIHRRRALFLKSQAHFPDGALLIISDSLGGPLGSHSVEQFWHPGEAVVHVHPYQVRIGSRSDLAIPVGTQFEIGSHWRSRAFGEKTPTEALVVRRETALPAFMWAVVSVGCGPVELLCPGGNSDASVKVGQDFRINLSVDREGRLAYLFHRGL